MRYYIGFYNGTKRVYRFTKDTHALEGQPLIGPFMTKKQALHWLKSHSSPYKPT